ncbi:MAG: hypothetical protein WCE45_03815 [Sedimentisphaerales bacterium]
MEAGQILTGVVKYSAGAGISTYLKAFSSINHLSALLLLIINSEKIVSIIISALLGMISFQAIGLFIYSINKNICISVIGVILIYFANYVGPGVIYPIWFLGHIHTFGILGLSFIVLIIALINIGAYGIAFFCLGLAPCVHMTWAAWLFLVLLISASLQWDFAKGIIKKYYRYFIAGLFVTIVLLIYQFYLNRATPVIDSEIKKQYLDSYVKYWDYHRVKFYWGWESLERHAESEGIPFCVCCIAAGLFCLKYFKKDDSLIFISTVIIVSGILSLLFGLITQIPPEKIPFFLYSIMPGRFINLNNILVAAFFIGVLTRYEIRPYIFGYNLYVLLLVSSFFSKHWEVQIIVFAIILSWFLYLICAKNSVSHRLLGSIREHTVSYEKLLLIFTLLFIFVNLPRHKFISKYLFHRSDFKDRTNNEFYLTISKRDGLLATCDYLSLIQLRTRRPLLVDIESDFIIYTPEDVVAYNNILQKVYGINLLIPPPKELQHRVIAPKLYKTMWEKRTIEEWQQIRRDFNVTDILSPEDWKLSLPVVIKAEKMILYSIP